MSFRASGGSDESADKAYMRGQVDSLAAVELTGATHEARSVVSQLELVAAGVLLFLSVPGGDNFWLEAC